VKITLGYLYPDIMSTHGDHGNVATIVRRCEWRSIGTSISALGRGDRLDPAEMDLIIIGGGGEDQQRLIAPDLNKVKGPAIREAFSRGAAGLAVAGGYELFGHFCQPARGAEYPGAEVFDTWTLRPSSALGGTATATAGTGSERGVQVGGDAAVGDLVVAWGASELVGFESHSGGTYLGATAEPLGQVISGFGNNGAGTEGVISGNVVGTNLRGPCLPKNPLLADFLISAALSRRYGDAELPPLSDEVERAAHETAIRRARHGMRARAES